MRKMKILCLSVIGILSACGGGPSSVETGIENMESSYVQQDVRCCLNYDEENNVCTEYAVPDPASFKVTIRNESLDQIGDSQPIQVKGCTAEFYPKDGAPEILNGSNYITCSSVTIDPDSQGEVLVSFHSPLVELMNSYYLNLGRILSYRVKLTFDIEGYYSGEYDTVVYVDVDFSDFIKTQNDICGE